MAVRHAPVSMEPVLLVKQQPHSLAFLSPPWSSEPLLFLETLLSQDHGDEVMAFFYVMLIPEMVQHPSPWTVPSQYNVVSSLFFSGSCSFPALLLVAHKLIAPLLHPQAASCPLLSDRQTAV